MRTKFFPGWKMTYAQHGEYFRTWAAISAQHGWNKEQAEEQRRLAHTRAFGFVKSRTEIDHLADYTKIKAEFMALLHPDQLAPVLKQEKMPETNLRHKVMIDCVKLLSVAIGSSERQAPASEVNRDIEAAQEYITVIMRERFSTDDINDINDQRPHPDAYSNLEKLVFTLERCINDMRNKRGGATRDPITKKFSPHTVPGWTMHDLKTAAGVSCGCAQCRPKPMVKLNLPKEVTA